MRRGAVVGAVWWAVRALVVVLRMSPSLGSRTLVVVRRYGEAVRVTPIGTFAADPRGTRAFAAQHAVLTALAARREGTAPKRAGSALGTGSGPE